MKASWFELDRNKNADELDRNKNADLVVSQSSPMSYCIYLNVGMWIIIKP